MHDATRLENICGALSARYGEAGREAVRQLRKWLSGDVPFADPETIERHLDEQHLPLIFDAFRQAVPFGTGGQRGPVGYGPNRINSANVAITVQGHCNYLRATHGDAPISVVVASDVRVFNDLSGRYKFLGDAHPLIGASSRSFGRLACEIYAGNGITAHFPPPERYEGTMSTPEMAFHIRRLGAVGGIQMSASHNPPDDNGLKIYNEFGSQPIAPEDERLAGHMDGVRGISTVDFDEGLRRGLILWTTQETHDDYIGVYTSMYGDMPKPDPALPIVYAPLNGCGLSSVGEVLDRVGFKVLIPPGEGPDGSFAAVPLRAPNPEVSQATVPAMAFADQAGSGIVLSSDPDVDRVGVDVKLADGSWHHFDGNQIAAVLARFLILDPRGPQRKGLVIETFVTTRLLGEIARKADSPLIDDLPVGMKYVANVLNELETHGRFRDIELQATDLAFAAEESHGAIVAPYIREKDAAPACMYLACLYQILHREGRTLLDYYVETLAELGAHETVNRSIVMTGADGARDKDAIMRSLRDMPLSRIGGARVKRTVDFWDETTFGPFKGATDRLSRDAIQFFTGDFIIAVRPSGTEPKLKLYCQLLPPKHFPPVSSNQDLAKLKTIANKITSKSYTELLAIIGRRLGGVALLLPDIIDLNQKIRFEREILPGLQTLANSETPPSLEEALDWLRREAAALIPGADPLPALKGAIAEQCREWKKAGAVQGPLPQQLKRWAEDKPVKGRAAKQGTPFVIVSANCGGAARAIAASDFSWIDRTKAVGDYIQQASPKGAVIAGLQELARFDDPTAKRPSYAAMMGLTRKAERRFFYVPTLSTGWYPQKKKWQGRWDEGVCHAEQGVAACAVRGAVLHDPEENTPEACGGAAFAGVVLDLPVVQFRRGAAASAPGAGKSWANWITHTSQVGDAPPYELIFRHTRYLGDRDTEPRAATAHRVRLDKPKGEAGEFIFINLHLTTLREPAGDKSRGMRARRTASPEAEFLRHLQLSEVCDFIWRVYTDEALPVIVAGDFNTAPDRPDLKQFMANARLRPVFTRDRCWGCGGAPLAAPKQVYSNESHSTVLTEDAETFARITGETAQPVQATEYCSRCSRPLFTHKRNFQLVDNILYTDGAPPGASLKARIAFDDPEANAGIGTDTHFSDHFPIWSRFRLV